MMQNNFSLEEESDACPDLFDQEYFPGHTVLYIQKNLRNFNLEEKVVFWVCLSYGEEDTSSQLLLYHNFPVQCTRNALAINDFSLSQKCTNFRPKGNTPIVQCM